MSRDHDHDNNLAEAMCGLTFAIAGLARTIENNNNQSILKRLAEMENRIMSVLSEFAGRVDAKFTAISDSVDSIVTSQGGITGDIAALKALILQLQTNPGPISPEDQVLLDAAEAKLNTLADKAAATATALAALDAATEEVPAPPA